MITMASDQQHTSMNTAVDPEPLTGLNLISDTSSNTSTSKKSNALAEIDSNSASKLNSNAFASTETKSTTGSKKVSIIEAKEAASGTDETLEAVLPEGEDNEDHMDDDIGELNMQTGIGEKKKKKKKKKPKSQRGLVGSKSLVA